MEAASADHIGALLAHLADELATGVLHAAPTTALIVTRMRNSSIGLDDMHRLSSVFLDDRKQSMKDVLGPHAYEVPDVDFVFFPIVESCASTFIDRDRTTIFLSLGLMEALRLAIASAQLDSAIRLIEKDQAITDELGTLGRGKAVEQLRLMIQYFNASAVLHFKAPRRLPAAASLLDAATRHRIDVVLEAVLMFLLLHELGHVDYRRQSKVPDQPPHLVWEFAVPEDVNEAKREEFYADAFALRSVPEAFALPLVHAATFFLHLHNYVDATAGAGPTTHPLCVNRIATLYALVRGNAPLDAVGHDAVAVALEAGSKVWSLPSEHMSVDALQRYTEALSTVDWQPAQDALQLLAAHVHPDTKAS